MSTPLQNEANRRNSRLSKGPKTAAGKARSATNALKHGLLSGGVLLPDEDEEAFFELSMGLSEDLKPVGKLELLLVERIIDLCWRLQRARKFEAAILAWYRADLAVKSFDARRQQAQRSEAEPGAAQKDEARDFLESYKETELAMSGEVYIDDTRGTNALATLSRHETSIERSFFKTLHELERRQAMRQGKEVPLPLAVDIDVSGAEPGALRIMARGEPQTVEETSLERPNDAAD
jgi:hypothetical protein